MRLSADIVEQQLEEDDAGLYDVSLWSHPLSLTAPAPGPHLSAGQRSREGIQEGQLAQHQQEQQVPRTPRSTAVPAVPTPAVAVRSDQFTAAMQGLHDLGTTVATGGGEAAVARAEQHRRMSQMSTNYTDVSALHCIHITIMFIYPTHSIYLSISMSVSVVCRWCAISWTPCPSSVGRTSPRRPDSRPGRPRE